jgi:two-component system response regulator
MFAPHLCHLLNIRLVVFSNIIKRLTQIPCQREIPFLEVLSLIPMNENGPILLVENDAKDILLTLHALERSHVKNDVIVVRDGIEALDYLFASGRYAGQATTMPEFILLGLHLPKVSAREVLEEIRGAERTRTLPVIVMTSSADEENRFKTYGLGVSCIRKPVEFKDFLDALLQCGLHWLVVTKSSEARVAMHQLCS